MSDWLLKKISWMAGCMTIAVLFGLIVLAANIEIKDLDFWLHLAAGKFIVQTFSIPFVDVLSATAAGSPWTNHEWLFQAILYSIYNAQGIDGLINFRVWLVFTNFALLMFFSYSREMKPGPIFLLLLVLLVHQLRFTIRPDLFSLLFTVGYIIILRAYLDRRWSVWALVTIQILWANIHGFFFIGPLIISIDLASEFIRRRIKLPYAWNETGRLSEEDYKKLKILLPIALLACLVNPYFIKGALYPVEVLFSIGQDSGMFLSQIQELKPALQWNTLFAANDYLPYKLLIVITLASFALNYRKIDISLLVLWAIVLCLSLSARRNIVFFSVISFITFVENMRDVSLLKFAPKSWQTQKVRTIISLVFAIGMIGWMIDYGNQRLLRGYYDFDSFERKSEYKGISLRNFPHRAANFLVRNNIRGRFFNDFNSGAYLLGRASPNVKVFIDGRTELYGDEFYNNYRDIWRGNRDKFDNAVKKYDLTGAFLSYMYQPAPARFIRRLYEDPNWALVYFDYDASVFLREGDFNRAWIDRYKIDLAKRPIPQADLIKISTHNVQPYRYINRAYALFNIGLHRQAWLEAEQALRIEPYNVKALTLFGRINNDQGRYEEAFEHLRKAKLTSPKNPEVRYQIARSLYHLGRIDEAIAQCQRALSHKGDHADSLLLMSLILAEKKEYGQMSAHLQKVKKDVVMDTQGYLQLGNLLSRQKEYQLAFDVYAAALEIEPDNREVRVMLDMNQLEQANE